MGFNSSFFAASSPFLAEGLLGKCFFAEHAGLVGLTRWPLYGGSFCIFKSAACQWPWKICHLTVLFIDESTPLSVVLKPQMALEAWLLCPPFRIHDGFVVKRIYFLPLLELLQYLYNCTALILKKTHKKDSHLHQKIIFKILSVLAFCFFLHYYFLQNYWPF